MRVDRPAQEIDTCPSCGGTGVGRVGLGQYYCRECFIEFEHTARGWQLFHIGDEGDLIFWKEVARIGAFPGVGEGGGST